jgi:hypothetical protein
MATTYNAIATVTVGSGGAASIEFTSIPGTYTDLAVLISARNTGSSVFGFVCLQPNSATTNLSSKLLYGYGSGSGSASYSDQYSILGYITGANATSNTFGNSWFYIPNYAGSSNKSVSVDSVNENNATDGRQSLVAGLWSSTSAITSLKFIAADNNLSSVNFVQYSTATLYGIKNS